MFSSLLIYLGSTLTYHLHFLPLLHQRKSLLPCCLCFVVKNYHLCGKCLMDVLVLQNIFPQLKFSQLYYDFYKPDLPRAHLPQHNFLSKDKEYGRICSNTYHQVDLKFCLDSNRNPYTITKFTSIYIIQRVISSIIVTNHLPGKLSINHLIVSRILRPTSYPKSRPYTSNGQYK